MKKHTALTSAEVAEVGEVAVTTEGLAEVGAEDALTTAAVVEAVEAVAAAVEAVVAETEAGVMRVVVGTVSLSRKVEVL